jgi:uncharacterized membrane protein YfcA
MQMPVDPQIVALVAVTYLLAGIVKGVTGLGIPIVGVALTAPVIGMQAAVAILLAPSIVTNFWQALVGGRLVPIVRRIWPLLLAAVFGIWLGTKILATADGSLLILILGLFLITYATIALLRAKLPSPGSWEPVLTPLMGGAGGIIFGMTGSFMVPGTLYIQALGMPRDEFVQALGIAFVFVTCTLALAMLQRALLSPDLAVLSAGAVLPTVGGMMLGQRLRRILTESQFTRVVLVVILATGLYMVLRAVQ